MAKLPHTSATVITLTLILLNLEKSLSFGALIFRSTMDYCRSIIDMLGLLSASIHFYIFPLDYSRSSKRFHFVHR